MPPSRVPRRVTRSAHLANRPAPPNRFLDPRHDPRASALEAQLLHHLVHQLVVRAQQLVELQPPHHPNQLVIAVLSPDSVDSMRTDLRDERDRLLDTHREELQKRHAGGTTGASAEPGAGP